MKLQQKLATMFPEHIPGQLHSVVDKTINELVNGYSNFNHFFPKVDVLEKDNNFELHVYIPGMKKEEIEVSVEKDLLTVKGERRVEKTEENVHYRKMESQFGTFSRTFVLPKNIQADQIEAEYKDGILQIVLPKTEATKAVSSTITVK